MNRSMSLRTVASAAGAGGTAGRVTGCQAQWSSRGSRSLSLASRSASDSGQAAPESIHCSSSAISAAESRSPSGGIFFLSSVLVIRWISSLSPLLPATITGPKSPPFNARCLTSSRSRLSCVSGPWQSPQRPTSSGRICRSKSMAAGASAAGAVGGSPNAGNEITLATIRQAAKDPSENRLKQRSQDRVRDVMTTSACLPTAASILIILIDRHTASS